MSPFYVSLFACFAFFFSLFQNIKKDSLKSAALATMVATNWNKSSLLLQKTSTEASQMQTQSVLHGKTTCKYTSLSVVYLSRFGKFYIVKTAFRNFSQNRITEGISY